MTETVPPGSIWPVVLPRLVMVGGRSVETTGHLDRWPLRLATVSATVLFVVIGIRTRPSLSALETRVNVTVDTEARSLTVADRSDFLRIYEEAFPAAERMPFDEERWRAEGRQFTIARFGGTLVGFGVALPMPSGEILVEYLAVEREFRGAGIGSRILGAMRSLGAEELVLEVEDPYEGGLSKREWAVRNRRLAFYRDNGFRPCRPFLSYQPPSFSHDRAPRLVLLTSLPDEGREGDTASRIGTVLAESYGCAPDDSARRVHDAVDRSGQLR